MLGRVRMAEAYERRIEAGRIGLDEDDLGVPNRDDVQRGAAADVADVHQVEPRSPRWILGSVLSAGPSHAA
jgi:hypothetical protein